MTRTGERLQDAKHIGRHVADIVRRPARLFPSKLAVVDAAEHPFCPGGHTYSWGEVFRRVEVTAGFLASSGLRKGERVAVLSLNSHHYFELYFAVPLAGGILVPLNYRLADPELSDQLEEAEPSLLLTDAEFEERGRRLASRVHSVRQTLSTGSREWESGLRKEHRLEVLPDVVEDDPVGIFYTGGAGGRSKGAVLTHRNLFDAAVQIGPAMGYREDDVYLHAGPMFHLADGAGSLSCSLLGATHVFIPSFDPLALMDVVHRWRVTTFTLVPTMYRMLMDAPEFDPERLSSLRRIFFSAAPMPEAMIRSIFECFPCGIGQGYGMTEASSRIAVMPPETYAAVLQGTEARKHLLSSAGREVPGLEVRIVDDEGREVGVGEVGEIVVRGTVVMSEYWRRPDLTASALRGGWLHTGDLGYLDGDGYLYVVDRLKDMIISGGENVYSLEVESVIARHPAVADVAVVGLPDELWGERVHAVVVPRPGSEPTASEIRAFCRQHLAGYKVPKSVEFVQELPRTAAGKVLKDRLKTSSVRPA